MIKRLRREVSSTWYCYDCKKDMPYIDDENSPKCPSCGKGYTDFEMRSPISHKIRTFFEEADPKEVN